MPRLCVLLLVAALPLGSAATPPGPDTPASEVAAALQRKYDAIRDFSADFVHAYEGGVLKKRVTERGHVLVKKPGKMRWEYTEPERKLFVSDGAQMYSYIPQDKQVIVSKIPAEDEATTPTLFLAGKGNLTRDFSATLTEVPPSMPPNSRALKLVPKTPQRDYDWLVLVVDASTLAIRGLVTTDAQGGKSTFSFGNLKENVGVADKEFAFRMPHGVDVLQSSPRD